MGHLGYGPKQARQKLGRFKRVENGLGQSGCGSGWPVFSHLNEKNKCQLFSENESNQIVRPFVLIYCYTDTCDVKGEKKTKKPKNIEFPYPYNSNSFDF